MYSVSYRRPLTILAATVALTALAVPGIAQAELIGPDLTLTGPAAGATVSGAGVALTAACVEPRPCDRVEFLIDGQVVGTDTNAADGWSQLWDSGAVGDGPHGVSARGHRASNDAYTITAANAVTVDNIPDAALLTNLVPSLPGAVGDNTMLNIKAGDAVTFNGNWAAQNANTGGQVRIEWYVDGQWATNTLYPPVDPGGAGSQSQGTWTATAGPHVVKMVLDPLNSITESDETDNESTRAFTVATPPTPAAGTISKVLVVIEENHSLDQMRAQMPYLAGLAQQYGYTSNFTAIRHPSLPNYLAIAGGSTFGVTDDAEPASHPISGASVFGQALSAGLTAHTYAETMPSNCKLTGNTDLGYAVKHNPWAYFTGERTACATFDTPDGGFLADAQANRLANVSMLIPNKCNDAHDCSLGTADNWLKGRLPAVLASEDFTSGRLAVVVTADEDDQTQGNKVLTAVLAKPLDGAHKVVSAALTHYSLSRLLSQVSGQAGLRSAATAPDMAAAFGLTVAPATPGGGTGGGGGGGAVDRGPSGTRQVFADTFETGLTCGIWTRMQNNDTAGTGASSLCADLPATGTPRGSFPDGSGFNGGRAFRSEVQPGDLSASGERSELSGDGAGWIFHEGDEAWLQERINVQPGMNPAQNNSTSATSFYILTQWHAGSGSPPLSLQIGGDGSLRIVQGGSGTIADAQVLPAASFVPGTWYDVDIHFKMSTSASTGGVEVFVNGVRAMPWDAGATMADADSYLKIGQYRNKRNFVGVVLFDDVRLSTP